MQEQKNEQKEETNIIRIEDQKPVAFEDMDALEIIERRSAMFERLLAVAVRATNANDWTDQGGKPYLQSSGAEKAARRFGVSIIDVIQEREDLTDDNGRYYVYTTTGKALLGKECIEAVGTSSSRDKFFGRQGGSLKPIQDVDIANIRKKSYTNFLGNAVRKLLGLNGLTWEQLERQGIKKGGVIKVAFKNEQQAVVETKKARVEQGKTKRPFWSSEYNGKTYLMAVEGEHFGSDFLLNLGMKQTKKAGMFSCVFDQNVQTALEEEFIAAEEVLSK